MSKLDDQLQDTKLALNRADGIIGQCNLEIAGLTKELSDCRKALLAAKPFVREQLSCVHVPYVDEAKSVLAQIDAALEGGGGG